jgi:hypothetical protein
MSATEVLTVVLTILRLLSQVTAQTLGGEAPPSQWEFDMHTRPWAGVLSAFGISGQFKVESTFVEIFSS